MSQRAYLVLEDGSIYEGYAFGAQGRAYGEVVFNTSMTGYQEMLTDPSYAGQIVVPTYPLIGNYGINDQDIESNRIQVRGFVVREVCDMPSHWQSQRTLHEYLVAYGVPGIFGVDTRALTRKLRSIGVMMGTITSDETPEVALERLHSLPAYGLVDYVREVSVEEPYRWSPEASQWQPVIRPKASDVRPQIVVMDFGLKYNILRVLTGLGCRAMAVPCTLSAQEVISLEPDGIVLSPGPGDPALLDYIQRTVRDLVGQRPILGICLGHQMLGWAFGGHTYKLKFGHRGGNHPVQDLKTGRVYITAQNHGYAVDGDSLPPEVEVTHINLNDGTVEGMRHRYLPIMSIQYHSEASPGPWDNTYLFERFLELVKANRLR